MKVVKFPSNKKVKSCKCRYMYRMAYNEDQDTYGAIVAKDIGQEEPKHLSFLSGFEYESEAEAAAWGFMEALTYARNGGEL